MGKEGIKERGSYIKFIKTKKVKIVTNIYKRARTEMVKTKLRIFERSMTTK